MANSVLCRPTTCNLDEGNPIFKLAMVKRLKIRHKNSSQKFVTKIRHKNSSQNPRLKKSNTKVWKEKEDHFETNLGS